MKKVCEVLTLFKDGIIYPVKFRYYAVEKATYYTVDVDKIKYIKIKDCNGLKEKTYRITGSRNRLKEDYELYLDPKSKTWWIIWPIFSDLIVD